MMVEQVQIHQVQITLQVVEVEQGQQVHKVELLHQPNLVLVVLEQVYQMLLEQVENHLEDFIIFLLEVELVEMVVFL
tara:strand:+ start:154 stop:384 length:231 start_codon:yes stop_codon:yes gene_type:complete